MPGVSKRKLQKLEQGTILANRPDDHNTPAAIESWGRLGPGFERLLRQLEARWAGLRHADASAAAATGRRWTAELGVAQARALQVTLSRANRTSRQSEGSPEA